MALNKERNAGQLLIFYFKKKYTNGQCKGRQVKLARRNRVSCAPNGPSMSLHSLEVEQNGTGSITLDNVKGSALRLRGAAAYVMKAGLRVETIWRS